MKDPIYMEGDQVGNAEGPGWTDWLGFLLKLFFLGQGPRGGS